MSWLAYYAPLKSPNHPTPSGDREMARNLRTSIERATGMPTRLASELRSRDGSGKARVQKALITEADNIAEVLCGSWQNDKPRLWVTYHNYYKAPDLIGPKVASHLKIPYVLVEATRARKRLVGPWAEFAEWSEQATDAANLVFYMTKHDYVTLERDRPDHQKLVHLHPFLPLENLPIPSSGDGPMLTVGMMRPGDKLASYRLIASALERVTKEGWRLDIVGDGTARAEVEDLFRPFGSSVCFLGMLTRAELEAAYQRASLFFWPGVNEAYGMVYLEAQAAGLPVVAQDRPGVRDILAPSEHPAPEAGCHALAKRIDDLLSDPDKRKREAANARTYIQSHHLLPSAVRTLNLGLMPLLDLTA